MSPLKWEVPGQRAGLYLVYAGWILGNFSASRPHLSTLDQCSGVLTEPSCMPCQRRRYDLTLPTATAGGFLLHGSLPWLGEPVPVLQLLHRRRRLAQPP